LTTLEERFSGALHNTSRAWKAAIDRRLKYLGVSQASWTTIATIAKTDAPMSQIELANKLGIEAATMVTMIDRLSKAGLILREASPVDRRVKLIVLTEEGKALYAKVKHEAFAAGDRGLLIRWVAVLSGFDECTGSVGASSCINGFVLSICSQLLCKCLVNCSEPRQNLFAKIRIPFALV